MSTSSSDGAFVALHAYRAALEPAVAGGALYEFSFAPLDRLDLPLWSVALLLADGTLCDGFGYGATLAAAQTSAWGETVEWYFARQALQRMPRRVASYRSLRAQGIDAVDPVALCLSAGSRYTPDQPLQWVEGRRHPTGDVVLVPIEVVAPRYADIGSKIDHDDFVLTPITNGLGAGLTFEHALAHGLLELLQRDGNSVHYRALDQGIAVELDEVRNEETRAVLQYLDAAGVEVIVKLAATDFGLTNLYVVGADRDPTHAPQPITLSACGEAVHPDRERALAKALREYVSARARKPFNHGPLGPVRAVAPQGYLEAFRPTSMRNEDDRATASMREWISLDHHQFYNMIKDPVLHVRSRVRFSNLPTVAPEAVADASDLLALLTERMSAAGLDIIYVPFTAPDASVQALKAVVPGLEVETMTYARIGRRNLQRLLDRNSPLVNLGQPAPGAQRIVLRAQDEAQLGGPAWLNPAALNAAVGRLYALYREPSRHVLGFEQEQGRND